MAHHSWPTLQPLGRFLNSGFARYFQGGWPIKANADKLPDNSRDIYHSVTKRDQAHPAAKLFPSRGLHLGWHILPVHVPDAPAKDLHKFQRITPAQPGIARIQVDTHSLLVTESIQNPTHAFDCIGEHPVRFNQ